MKQGNATTQMLIKTAVTAGVMFCGYASAGQAYDLNLAQPEKIIQMLERSGKLDSKAPQADKQAAYEQYLASLKSATKNESVGELDAYKARLEAKTNHRQPNYVEQQVDGASAGDASGVTLEQWFGETRTDRVLAILIEFPDYPHNSVRPWETSNYYEDYNREHYQDLLFSPTGYRGTDGENSLTMRQYYIQQSGGSYTVDGKTVGWVKAKHPAAYYGGNNGGNARALVREALDTLANNPDIDLSWFDQEDRYDLDGDGNRREPDGLIDHLMIFHAGVGEEAGGGALGEDAIWSHRWNLGGVYALDDTDSGLGYWGGKYAAYDYTIQPIDAAVGVCAHEYAHDLGLPDEYDTQYSGLGDTVSSWSSMSSGSWAGAIPGYEPVGFSTWAKEFLQNKMPESNWLSGATRHLNDFDHNGETFVFDQANDKGTNHDHLRIDLPLKKVLKNAPFAGAKSYWSQQGNRLNNSMSVQLDLTSAKTAELNFKAAWQIENGWDYGSVRVDGKSIPGNITTTDNPQGANPGHGITGFSDGWVDANFDLGEFVGQKVTLSFHYVTDNFEMENGLFVDNIAVTVDGAVVLSDDAEGASAFTLNGFEASDGYESFGHYYLLEWRNHAGVDQGLAHVGRVVSYEPGLLIWYVDSSVQDNAVGNHPGDSWLGVIDADIMPMYWSTGELATNRYQLRDATFSLTPTQSPMHYTHWSGRTVTDLYPLNYSQMADWNYYMNPWSPQSGRILQQYGLYITVEQQAEDRSAGQIRVRKMW